MRLPEASSDPHLENLMRRQKHAEPNEMKGDEGNERAKDIGN